MAICASCCIRSTANDASSTQNTPTRRILTKLWIYFHRLVSRRHSEWSINLIHIAFSFPVFIATVPLSSANVALPIHSAGGLQRGRGASDACMHRHGPGPGHEYSSDRDISIANTPTPPSARVLVLLTPSTIPYSLLVIPNSML